jgi:rubrerythrin
MAEKPSYLGLLNAIACAETNAHEYLTAWAAVTSDPDVRKVLTIVATREGEHGMAFAKRIHELGFEVRMNEDPKHAERMEIACSDRGDLDKLEALGILDVFTSDDKPDIFDGFFKDHSIDIATGGLLGRYIAEERDTGRLLKGCRATLVARTPNATAAEPDGERLNALEERVDSLLKAVEDVRGIVTRAFEIGKSVFLSRMTMNGHGEHETSDTKL